MLGTDDANVLRKGCKASACVVRRTLTHDAKHASLTNMFCMQMFCITHAKHMHRVSLALDH